MLESRPSPTHWRLAPLPQARPLATEGPGTNAVRYSQQQLDFLARKQPDGADEQQLLQEQQALLQEQERLQEQKAGGWQL